MTTIAYDRRNKTIGTDSRNTDDSGQVFSFNKIEKIAGGRYFLGSGNCYTISLAKKWANDYFSENSWPDFEVLFGDKAEDYGMSCLIISADGEQVILIDSEMTPMLIEDDIVATGSGGIAAKAALLAGATMEEAIAIAISCDGNSGHPIRIHRINNESES